MNKALARKFCRAIQQIVLKMEQMKLSFEEICTNVVFGSKAYEDPKSHEFFKYCKEGQLRKLIQLVRRNKYLVYSYDETRKTGLHWAAKRKFNKIAQFLLDSGADVNWLDMAGRSPLFMAAGADNYPGTKLLLYYRADPNVITDGKRGVLHYAASLRIKSLIETAKRVRISMDMVPRNRRAVIWKQFGIPNFILKDDELEIQDNELEIHDSDT